MTALAKSGRPMTGDTSALYMAVIVGGGKERLSQWDSISVKHLSTMYWFLLLIVWRKNGIDNGHIEEVE